MADLSKNIYWGDPVIAIVEHGFHAVVVNGVTWQELETASPQADYVIVRDPLRSSRVLYTVGDWLNNYGQACATGSDCLRAIMRSGRRSFAVSELADFDYNGGVYSGPPPPGAAGRYKDNGYGLCYWDPNDSGPDQCSPSAPTGRYKMGPSGCYWEPNDSGPDQCSPEPAAVSRRNGFGTLLRMIARAGRNGITARPRSSLATSPVMWSEPKSFKSRSNQAGVPSSDSQ